jgi:four helix bundle protein
MNTHRKLHVWILSQRLIAIVYQVCDALPNSENFIAEPQIKRAAWSVQNNIAEGNARRGRTERHGYFNVALSSLAEVDSMLGTISMICKTDHSLLKEAETLRRQITTGVLAMVKNGRK